MMKVSVRGASVPLANVPYGLAEIGVSHLFDPFNLEGPPVPVDRLASEVDPVLLLAAPAVPVDIPKAFGLGDVPAEALESLPIEVAERELCRGDHCGRADTRRPTRQRRRALGRSVRKFIDHDYHLGV